MKQKIIISLYKIVLLLKAENNEIFVVISRNG